MGGSKMGLGLLLILSFSAGCPLEDDPVEDGQSNAIPADGDSSGTQNGGGANEPGSTGDAGDDNSSDNGDADLDAGGNGESDAGATGAPDASSTSGGTDASGTSGGTDAGHDNNNSDNGSNGDGNNGETDLDAGGTGKSDAGDTGGFDASVTGGDADASTPEPDAGPGDAGSSEPDSHVEEDAGPPIVVPDLGDASMTDVQRAKLIVDYLAAEGYVDTWYPVLQSEAVQRPLIVSPSHGTSVRAFQNRVAKHALDGWVGGNLPLPLQMPNGSVIIKESYKVDAMTSQVVPNGKLIMAKIDALDPVTYEGKWFFMRITTANVAARATTCIDCHNGRKAIGAWPVNADTNLTGGSPDALVPYDYMFIPYCYDARTPECVGPN